jgi:hypothetical protein
VQPLLAAEQRFKGELFVAEEHVEGRHIGTGRRADALCLGAQPGLGARDDDQFLPSGNRCHAAIRPKAAAVTVM